MSDYFNVRQLLRDARLPSTKAATATTGVGIIFILIGCLAFIGGLDDGFGIISGSGFAMIVLGILFAVVGSMTQILYDIRTLMLIDRSNSENEAEGDA